MQAFSCETVRFLRISILKNTWRLLLIIKISTSCHVYIKRYMSLIIFVLIFFMKTIYNRVF